MTYLPDNDSDKKQRGLMEFLYWCLYVAVFLFAAWLLVNLLTTHGIIS